MRVNGTDAFNLLQKLISQDLSGLGAHAPVAYSLLLTPQGKYLHDFFVIWTANALYLDTPAHQTDAIIGTLNKYKLRSDVAFEPMPEKHVRLFATAVDAFLCVPDPRAAGLGYRIWGDELTAIDSDYEQKLTCAGVVEPSFELISGASMPIEFGLQNLHAISFTKGCYLGQELTARMQHKGLAKRVVIVAKADNNQVVAGDFEGAVKDTATVEIGAIIRTCTTADATYFLLHVLRDRADETVFNVQRSGCGTAVQLARC